ncbi:cell wall-binding repeat-containing protein [Leifsonia sp. fls2-241-R2A-40a]|uniref:cell wall-binding repeat-containing protein n=1 Tax=Leifsonia sp. fls2-241-R2A-40a TaxID=3040290 RepID=UPI00254E44FC|nr:cell wall-binding repeat-containing protein [Leifsonia sp. fls2-241-R2A-40a]
MNDFRRRRVRTVLLGAVTAVAAILGLAVAPLSASAATTYSLSGTITYAGAATTTSNTETGVRLYPVSGDGNIGGRYVTVANAAGGTTSWSISGVAPGRYRIFAQQFLQGDNVGPGTAGTWYGGSATEDGGTIVTVDHNLTGLTIDRPAAGSISGTITGPAGKTSPDVVEAWPYDKTTGLFERAVGFGDVNTSGSGNYTIRNLNPGTYVVRFGGPFTTMDPPASTQYYPSADNLWDSHLVTVTAGQNVTGIDGTVGNWSWYSGRISGGDRFETSSAISSSFYNDGASFGAGPVVYVANGMVFPDALGASAAAAWWGGPLLLTRQDFVPAAIVTELKRLKPSKIVVAGGLNAVGASAFSQLKPLAPTVTRIAGDDRFATSRAVVQDAFAGETSVNALFIATGTNFPDALVAGSAAGHDHGPLVLVNGSAGALDSATKSLITSLSPKRIYLVGGVNSVSAGIQADLGKLGAPSVLRLSGADRFATAQAVNQEVFRFADEAYVASGLGFPDALSISAIAGAIGSPLLLAPPQCIPYGEVVDSTTLGVSTYWAVGGTNALSSNITSLAVCPQGLYGSSAPVTGKSADTTVLQPASPQPADPSTLRGTLSGAKELLTRH